MKYATLNYIHNLLVEQVLTTKKAKEFAWSDEAAQANSDIEEQMQSCMAANKAFKEATEALEDFEAYNW